MEGIANTPVTSRAQADFQSSRLEELKGQIASKDEQRVAQSFEELLAGMLIKELRCGSGVKLFGEASGSQIFEGLFDRFLAQSFSQSGGLGIGERYAEILMENRGKGAYARGSAPEKASEPEGKVA